MEREGTAFIGFTYNGKHSIDDFGIYRTGDGNRYNYNLVPQLNDKTADVPNVHGQYYFNSTYKTRQFSIPIAFENLSEEKFYKMKQWLNGTGLHELSFDERTEVKYPAKVTGTPQLKFICFEEQVESTNEYGEIVYKTENIYKGEGTIQFTCYFPFGYGEDEIETWNNKSLQNKVINEVVVIGGELPTTFIFTGIGIIGEIQIGNLKITPSSNNFCWDSKTGLITDNNIPIGYIGTSYGTIGIEDVTISFTLQPNGSATFTRKKLYY